MILMRRYTAKDEDDLIKQIESDPEIDKGWEPPVEGHVVEIRFAGNEDELSEEDKKDLEQARAEIKAGRFHTFEEVKRELRP